MARPGAPLSREEKLVNLIKNHTMIFMGMFEEAFSTLAEKMTAMMAEGTAALADAIAQGVPPDSTDNAKKLREEIPPEVREEVRTLFSEIREEMASQWPKDASLFTRYVASPAFDRGIQIVESYDFHRPRLTERLSDEVLASYVFLLQSGDEELGRMFRELSEWQSGLPKPPWAQ